MRIKDASMIEGQFYYYFQPNGAEIVIQRKGSKLLAFDRDNLKEPLAEKPIKDKIYSNVFYYGGDLQEAQPMEYEQIILEEFLQDEEQEDSNNSC